MKISIIAAMAQNMVIGRGNSIPWNIPGEQTRFKNLTMGKNVIMGRNTYESIGHSLSGRRIIVLSRGNNISKEVCVASSLESALSQCREEVFIAGGGQVYSQSLHLADILYLTILDQSVEGNVLFPCFDKKNYLMTHYERITGFLPYTYYTFERKK